MRGPISFQRISTLAFLTCLVITLTTLFKSAMELEDAEQAYYSQWFRLGYDDQPPFYTWLQIAMNRVFGVTNISFSLLRGLLFAGVLLVVYALARERGNSPERSKLSVLLLVLILVFIDFTFRRLSHTTLLCLTVVATCVIVQRLLRNASIWNYLIFGALMGLGMMSKYNYVFFILGFLVVSLWDESLRTVIWQPKILVSLLVFILILSPHGYWLWIHGPYQEVLQGIVEDKMNSGWSSHTGSVFPVLRFALGLFAMFFLMVGVVLLLWYRKQLQFTKSPSS